jgi:hypothetical protein
MVDFELVRELAMALPRTYETVVADRVKFKVGRLVYLAGSRDETLLGFGFPKEEREALVASEPDKYMMPKPADMRYHWAVARLGAINEAELTAIVTGAWRMVVPKFLAREVLGSDGDR